MAADTRLPAFLNDIGAASLNAKPSGAFAAHRARLDEEIQAVQLRIHQCLQGNRETIERQRAATASLTSRLETIQRELREVDEQLHDPQTGLDPKLTAAFERHSALQRDALVKQTVVSALSSLKIQHDHLGRLVQLREAGQLDQAVEVLQEAEVALNGAEHWLHSTPTWRQCQSHLAEQRSYIETELFDIAFKRAILVEGEGQTFRFTLLSNVQQRSTQLTLQALFDSLDKLSLLDKQLHKIYAALLQNLIRPALSGDGTVVVVENDVSLLRSQQGGSRLSSVLAFLRKLSTEILPALPARARDDLSAMLVDLVFQLIVTDVLLPSMSSTLDLALLKDYDALVKESNDFESQVQSMGFSASPILSSWTKDVHLHWAQRVSERVMAVIRDLVIKAQWKTEVVEIKAPKPKKRNARSRQTTPAPAEIKAVSPVVLESPAPQDDAWGFGEEAASPAVFAPPKAEEGEDAWGFDEEKPVASTSSPQKASPALQTNGVEHVGDDAWGFGEEEEDLATATAKMPKSAMNGDDDGGWGFDAESEPPTPHSAATKAAANRPAHGRSDSLAAWGWDEAEEAIPATTSPAQADTGHRRVSKGKLGAQRINGHLPKASAGKAVPPASVSPGPDRQAKPVPAGQPSELFTISTSSKQILAVSTELLADAKHLQEASFPYSDFGRAAPAIRHCSVDALDFFRAVMPVQHAQMLEGVPALGMQFANDCDWLARELSELELDDKVDAAFSTMAKATRDAQIVAQKVILTESLDDAAHFRGTSDPARFAACQRALQQISHTLERLSHVWKPPSITPSAYGTIMGELVSGVLARVLQEIEDQDDISESDSKRLNELCKMLHGLEALFVENGQSTVAVHVPLWFKFVFLSELLEASLVDIMFLFEEGHLVDFSAEELVKLLRALFADSANRAKAIDTIRAGKASQ